MLKVLLSIFPYKTGNSHLAYEISDTFLPFITVSRSRYAFGYKYSTYIHFSLISYTIIDFDVQ